MEEQALSVCGVCCSADCRAYQTECEGCNALCGKVSWAAHYGRENCPLYACALERGFASCGDCGEAPCAVWLETRSPLVSDEEFSADIDSRLENLARRKA